MKDSTKKAFQFDIKLVLGVLILLAVATDLICTYVRPRVEYASLNDQIVNEIVVTNEDVKDATSDATSIESISVNTIKLKTMIPSSVGYIYNKTAHVKYPIVQSDQDNYYLTHDYNGNSAKVGSIFMDTRSKWSDAMILIYGHNMKDGSMFGSLDQSNIGDVFTIFKNEDVYAYEVVDKVVRKDKDLIYSLKNPYDFDCIILSTCHGSKDRLTLTLKAR